MSLFDTQKDVQMLRGADTSYKALSAASVTAVILVWLFATKYALLAKSVLPSPIEVADALISLLQTPFAGATLEQHITASLGRFFAGFLLAVALGVPVGLAMGWSRRFRYVVAPFFEAYRFIAPLAWVPFAALWFGVGIGGPIMIVFSGAFAACVVNTFRGTRMTDVRLIEASRTMGAGTWRMVTDVFIPSAAPSIMAGVRIAAALGWQSLIGAELIVASSGAGYLIVQGQGSVETAIVMAGMVTIGFFGVLIDFILRLIEKRLCKNWSNL
ncbi:ABC transporter permease [Paraburkholderia caribensis]|uniref:ABC transporter permease n=1 Tax=Paraburkholderia TaxID=1822464 RepID=UPI001CAD88E8|nr:ABC transporter permease [Paraburkholderia caribensis]BEU25635.1 ABC transporter permease [Paraburkholderia sp. 22B1P]CAG9262459.1 NitT/TauT family transport system permease protein [Paraburkholderia caribensis]